MLLSNDHATEKKGGYKDAMSPVACWVKRGFDVTLSLMGLFVFSPVILVIGALIKLEDHGPAIFKQERVGYRGKTFMLYKFRSMKVTSEADGIPKLCQKEDDRLTRVGRFLREHHLDELPQLWNVLKGEMSIVGPRPALPREVAQYTAYEWQRLYVTPGLSCYWQIAPHRDQLSFEEWMDLDIKYVHERSFPVDWKIIFRTFRSMLFGHGE